MIEPQKVKCIKKKKKKIYLNKKNPQIKYISSKTMLHPLYNHFSITKYTSHNDLSSMYRTIMIYQLSYYISSRSASAQKDIATQSALHNNH